MASQLISFQNLKNKERNGIKYKIDCKDRVKNDPTTKNWLELASKFDHSSDDFKIYTGLLDKRKHIVAKIGPKKLEEEYEIGAKLDELNLPTFISFNCIFSCLDNFSELNNLSRTVCKKEGDPITIIIMPYMSEGRIDRYKWNRSNFPVMKNVIKHVCLSILYAYDKMIYLHLDMHPGNVLLKKTERTSISYGEYGSLELMGILPVIMDFEKSRFIENSYRSVYKDLDRFIVLMASECEVKMYSDKIRKLLYKLNSSNTVITASVFKEILKEIDNLEIAYINSEMPAMPNWLKPVTKK